jgi:hypothetical protein
VNDLTNLYSLINGYEDAKDRNRVFTFIEFIKEFGYDNSSDILLTLYRDYLTSWSTIKKRNDFLDDKEYIKVALTDTLKSITLSYSSYEEQDFLANIDWSNDSHKKALIPFFAEKIRLICNFYKNKRHELLHITNKNNIKGTRKSIEEIIYEKIIDFYFDNKNLTPQMEELQRNLTITLEEYIDIYSEYFDIPRNKKCNDKSRQELLNANINNVNHSDYLEVSKILSDMIYSGEIYLEEIPLIAEVGLNLSAECAGAVEDLRQELLNNATLNQISLSEQISIRRKLYEKFIGCDLYYIYSDGNKNLQSNLLVKAANPVGNLLNCGSADIAISESEQIKLISHIGLFFKPDKLGILKVHADNFTWEVDTNKIQPDTFYVFPEPGKYGDIGNNKDVNYPLIYEYKLNSVIKNLSSGFAKDEPLAFISSTTWNSYYSKQNDDFKLIDNKDFTYSFTKFSDKGLLRNYQVDMFGNEYGLFKGFDIDTENNIIYVPDFNHIPELNFSDPRTENDSSLYYTHNIILNGGYFVDPRYPSNKNRVGRKFNHEERMRIADDYIWTGIIPNAQRITTPDILANHFNFGKFESPNIQYIDHYNSSLSLTNSAEEQEDIITNVFESFISNIDSSKEIIKKKYTLKELEKKSGLLYFNDKTNGTITLLDESVKDFILIGETLIIIKDDKLEIYRYVFNGESMEFILMTNAINIKPNEVIKPLYNEKEDKILLLSLYPINIDNRFFLDFNISEYNPSTGKTISKIISFENHLQENNFEYKFSKEGIKDCVFSYNNNTNTYLVSYIINGIDDTPNLYVHTFKIYNQEQFNKTLESICYSNDSENKVYIFNEQILNSGTPSNLTFFIKDNG